MAFMDLAKRKRNAARLPLAATHTHTLRDSHTSAHYKVKKRGPSAVTFTRILRRGPEGFFLGGIKVQFRSVRMNRWGWYQLADVHPIIEVSPSVAKPNQNCYITQTGHRRTSGNTPGPIPDIKRNVHSSNDFPLQRPRFHSVLFP